MSQEIQNLEIEYFSDVLCVWAWIAERRNQELMSDYGAQVRMSTHFLDLFSDTHTRLAEGWKERGGYEAFARHVREAAEPYPDAKIHPDLWQKVQPTTSANAHLAIKAAELIEGSETAVRVARAIREAFFLHAQDIGNLDVVTSICVEQGLSASSLKELWQSGRAIACLLSDMKLAQKHNVQGSPSWVMNQGRQVLYGNVGYRVIHANVGELLRRPIGEASWC